jgi:WhiB family transcriptional regulator, redox-sensing transcriptional regulator
VDDSGSKVSTDRWQDRANCRGLPTKVFFISPGEPTTRAKAVCAGCEVRAECFEAGLHEKFGIWGGVEERERRRVRKSRAVAGGHLPVRVISA